MDIGSFGVLVQDPVAESSQKEDSEASGNWKGKKPKHFLSRPALKQCSFLIYAEICKLCLDGHCNEGCTIEKMTLFASLKNPNTNPNKTTKTLRLRLSKLAEGRPWDSYPLKRRDKY